MDRKEEYQITENKKVRDQKDIETGRIKYFTLSDAKQAVHVLNKHMGDKYTVFGIKKTR